MILTDIINIYTAQISLYLKIQEKAYFIVLIFMSVFILSDAGFFIIPNSDT